MFSSVRAVSLCCEDVDLMFVECCEKRFVITEFYDIGLDGMFI